MDHSRVNIQDSYTERGEFLSQVRVLDGNEVEMTFNAPKIGFSAKFTFEDNSSPGHFWTIPQDEEKHLFFMNHKKYVLPTKGEYTYKGVTKTCGP